MLTQRIFYKSDDNVLYIYNGASWDAQGQSLSNLIFHYQASIEEQTTNGEVQSTSLTDIGALTKFRYMTVENDAYVEILTGKFKKISGISTVTVYAQLWHNSTGYGYLTIDIGGQTVELSQQNSTPTWNNGDIDVSGLTVGTVYDISVQLKSSTGSGNHGFLGSLFMFGV